MNLASVIDPTARDEQPAVVFAELSGHSEVMTYGGLRQGVAVIAAELKERGIAHGARVGLLAGNHHHYIQAFLAIMAVGAVACPLNWKLSPGVLAQMIDVADISVIFADKAREAVAASLGDVVLLDDIGDAQRGAIADITPVSVTDADLACIMFTSGSTGTPKAVPITHRGYVWGLQSFESERANVSAQTRSLVAAPIYHMNAQSHVLCNAYLGGVTVFLDGFSADGFLDAIVAHDVTEITGVPPMMAMALNAIDAGYEADVSSVGAISLGSAPLSAKLLARIEAAFPNARVANGYGTTETGIVSFGAHPDGLPTPPLSLGYPMAGVEWRLTGEGAPNHGVLHLATPMTTAGYLKQEALTARKRQGRWWSTGDVMRRDENGFFYFEGRADDMFVCGGENIYPAEVEALLERHPSVVEAAVVPVEDEVKGALPAAFVVPQASADLTVEDVKGYALTAGPAYAHPRHVWFLEALPMASTNKPDKAALAALAQRQLSTSEKKPR